MNHPPLQVRTATLLGCSAERRGCRCVVGQEGVGAGCGAKGIGGDEGVKRGGGVSAGRDLILAAGAGAEALGRLYAGTEIRGGPVGPPRTASRAVGMVRVLE